jgi:membrane-associated phospholipid phosphatase
MLLNRFPPRRKSVPSCFCPVVWIMPLVCLCIVGCGTLKNGQGWGQNAIYPLELGRIPRAAVRALFDVQTLAPAAGALIFAIDDLDEKVSDWAVQHTPLFGSEATAGDVSDVLLDVLRAEAAATALMTPSGNDPAQWLVAKAKGVAVEFLAHEATGGATAALKDWTDRTRPNGGTRSFPSAHASGAFSAATLANRNLDFINMPPLVRTSLQAGNILLASSVAWARIEARQHFPSDVLAGAALGHFVSAFIHDAFLGLPDDAGWRFFIFPAKDGAMMGMSWGF